MTEAKEAKHYYEVLPASVCCPNCSLHMTYVGTQKQDMQAAFNVADAQHWQRVDAEAGSTGGQKIEIPSGYFCFFCGVSPLSVSYDTWRLSFGHFSEADKANAELRKKILERDNYTCCDCSLRFDRHMEVRHLDENHSNNDPKNLKCVCPFCHMRDHLGSTGFAQAAHVIGSTRLSQAQINHVALMCWYITERIEDNEDIRVLTGETEDANAALLTAAKYLLTDLYSAGIRWVDTLSKEATDPYTFGTILLRMRYEVMEDGPEASDKDKKSEPKVKEVLKLSTDQTPAYRNRAKTLASMSLLPRREAFDAQCKDWFAYFDRIMPVQRWAHGLNLFLKTHELTDTVALYKLIEKWNERIVQERSGNFTQPVSPTTGQVKPVERPSHAPATPKVEAQQAAVDAPKVTPTPQKENAEPVQPTPDAATTAVVTATATATATAAAAVPQQNAAAQPEPSASQIQAASDDTAPLQQTLLDFEEAVEPSPTLAALPEPETPVVFEAEVEVDPFAQPEPTVSPTAETINESTTSPTAPDHQADQKQISAEPVAQHAFQQPPAAPEEPKTDGNAGQVVQPPPVAAQVAQESVPSDDVQDWQTVLQAKPASNPVIATTAIPATAQNDEPPSWDTVIDPVAVAQPSIAPQEGEAPEAVPTPSPVVQKSVQDDPEPAAAASWGDFSVTSGGGEDHLEEDVDGIGMGMDFVSQPTESEEDDGGVGF